MTAQREMNEIIKRKSEAQAKRDGDCTFHYFKASGKWYATGRGLVPRGADGDPYHLVDHTSIRLANEGCMPGLGASNGHEFVVVILPDGDVDQRHCVPVMLNARP